MCHPHPSNSPCHINNSFTFLSRQLLPSPSHASSPHLPMPPPLTFPCLLLSPSHASSPHLPMPPPLTFPCLLPSPYHASSPSLLHTSGTQHGYKALSVLLIAPGKAGDDVDWGLGIVIAVGSDSLVVDGPHALISVLVPFKDDIHTITVEQCLQSLSGDG